MSKDIRQYKKAMQSIRISESFMKRTETLLDELSTDKAVPVGKKPPVRRMKITIVSSLAAACLVGFIAVKTVMNNSKPNDISLTGQSEAAQTVVSEESSEQLYVDIENVDEAFAGILPGDMPQTSSDNVDVGAAQQLAPEPSEENEAAAHGKDSLPAAVNSNELDAEDDSYAAANGERHSINLSQLDISTVASVVTSYVNADADGKDMEKTIPDSDEKSIFALITYITGNSAEAGSNSKFVSEFVMTVNDADGETVFTVYLTDNQSMVITDHTGSEQVRTTYLLSGTDYSELERTMYLLFSTQSDYEAFTALKSGK